MEFKMLKCFMIFAIVILCIVTVADYFTRSNIVEASADEVAMKSGLTIISTDSFTRGVYQYTAYDPQTHVTYLVIRDADAGIAITPLYNTDGSLRIYNPE